ncbi:hypothetical protein [Streptomyces sp. NBC_00091]|uniref:hypothetical protein n=1 Tax=Streptomyces sp. NBC_00091 TaxID=2975648 RepID=UPI0022534CEB|nr:hypothetical protein [Streptomyces sp. NBC_00091]MCX5378698.1 hypothetical protein [Streptomyces sp. NBC_00091]
MSESPPRAPMRGMRAAMFAAVCVALGAVGHSYMSGTDVPFSSLLAAFAVTGALAWAAAGRRCGPAGITAALLAVQGILHLAFSAGQATGHGPAATAVAYAPEPMPGHHHVQGTAMDASVAATAVATGPDGTAGTGAAHGMSGMGDIAGGMGDMAGMAGHGGLGMIAAHVLAGVFCAAWLAWGEAAVFRLAGALGATALLAARPLARALALLRTRVAPVPGPPAHCPPYERPRRLRGAVHAHTAVRRGPPGRRDTRTTAPRPCRHSSARRAAGAASATPVPHPARA